jgi:L-threonylcarbamoyladenylate synthase
MQYKRIKLTTENSPQEVQSIIAEAVKALQNGQLVIFPTETCYGVGVDATNQEAVNQMLQYKARREGKPISVAVSNKEMATKYIEMNNIAENLYDNYLPGPITVVSKSTGETAKGLESEFGTLGIRIPDYKLVQQIVEKLNKPITSTSANVSYKPNPYSIDQLLSELPQKQQKMIGLIIDAGKLPKNPTSTVVDTTLNNLNVMRQGSISFDKDIKSKDTSLEANTSNAEETQDFGSLVMLKYLDNINEKIVVLALKGELGAGKTQFAKGLAKTLKINDVISSPTFTLVDEYPYTVDELSGTFYHMDTWRVDGAKEFQRTGIDQYVHKGNILAIEWADKFYDELKEMLKEKAKDKFQVQFLLVDFEYTGETDRNIKLYEEDLG